jgi:5-formyltetrahydrofolate cyclo-ligase
VDTEAEKRALRLRFGATRPALVAAGDTLAQQICDHLFAEAAFTAAATVALFAALPDEVPTRPLFEALARAGTSRLLPRVASGGRLVFARVERWEDLRPGHFGLLEPPESSPVATLGEGDVAIVPGVAFDRSGRRLGRGKGYYDRTFPANDAPQPLLVGLAVEAQIVEFVPCASHDRAMDAIVTERAFQWARGDG